MANGWTGTPDSVVKRSQKQDDDTIDSCKVCDICVFVGFDVIQKDLRVQLGFGMTLAQLHCLQKNVSTTIGEEERRCETKTTMAMDNTKMTVDALGTVLRMSDPEESMLSKPNTL